MIVNVLGKEELGSVVALCVPDGGGRKPRMSVSLGQKAEGKARKTFILIT